MISLGLLLVGLGLVQAGHHNHVLSEHFIEKINSANSTWRAGRNFHPETSHNFLRTLMGVHPMAHKHLPPPKPTLLGETIFLLHQIFFPCVKVQSFFCVKVGKNCRRILTRGRNGRSVQQSVRSETREVAALAGPLVLSPPCRTESASTQRGSSMCTSPARTSSLAATPVDLDATVDSQEQPGVSGVARVWSVVASTGPTRVASPTRLSPVSTMSTGPEARARREVALQNVTRPVRMLSSRFHMRRTRAMDRRATQSSGTSTRSRWS